LDECDLTVRDIARIQEAFVSMLKGIYHPRVQYPSASNGDSKAAAPKEEPALLPASDTHPSNGYTNGQTNGHATESLQSTGPAPASEEAHKVS
jgi:hypothetical protein